MAKMEMGFDLKNLNPKGKVILPVICGVIFALPMSYYFQSDWDFGHIRFGDYLIYLRTDPGLISMKGGLGPVFLAMFIFGGGAAAAAYYLTKDLTTSE
ncbi:hypothetical protein [Ruegeria sp. MALMAid1280]|uniref:hypothetical protein n=1 Tax=Ruegeria sp. MALMAid1280 TaxID=3411634 RepID=UPI003BA15F9B